MQKVNDRMRKSIEFMYNSVGYSNFRVSPNFNINYSKNNVFPLFFKVSLQGNKVELPIFIREYVEDYLFPELGKINISNVILNFYTDGYGNKKSFKSADSIIRYLSVYSPNSSSLYLATETNKGEIYYGCNGIIFNKDMVPLILNSIEYEITDFIPTRKKVNSYIHPSVFYSGGTVEKCIANKIIPFIMQNGIEMDFSGSSVSDNINYIGIGKVIPELSTTNVFDKFFCKPILQSVEYSNDNINDMLNRNIDDVFKIIGI